MTILTHLIVDREIVLTLIIIGLILAICVLNIRIDMLNKRIDMLESATVDTITVLTEYSNMFKEFRLLMEDVMTDLREPEDANPEEP